MEGNKSYYPNDIDTERMTKNHKGISIRNKLAHDYLCLYSVSPIILNSIYAQLQEKGIEFTDENINKILINKAFKLADLFIEQSNIK